MTEAPKEIKRIKKTKKTWRTKVTTSTGCEVAEKYCRFCMTVKNPKFFTVATDTYLNKDGLHDICNPCLEQIFQDCLASERDVTRAFLKFCRGQNWSFKSAAVETSIKTAEKLLKQGKPVTYVPEYKQTLHGIANISVRTGMNADMTFSEPSKDEYIPKELLGDTVSQDVIDFWIPGLPREDYVWLENELARWKKTHKADTAADETLLSEIVWTNYEIRKEKVAGHSTDSLVDKLQKLMKTAAVDPAKSTVASAGKSLENFSAFIKTIEETEPCEYYKDKSLFKDFDNIEWYFEKFVKRPLLNFIGVARDFNISDDKSDDEEDYLIEELEGKNVSENLPTE